VAKNSVGTSASSPEVTPQLVNTKPMCSSPGQLVVTDPTGDQLLSPSSPSLDITGVYVQEPAGTNDLAITLSVADLTSVGPLQQWRAYWDYADGSGNRWYVGMDTDATGAPSFIYGTNYGLDSPVKYAPGTQQTTNTALAGSGYNPANGTITIVVPRDQVGSPAAGSTLSNVQARTFLLTGGITGTSTTAIDVSNYSNYQVVGNSYCG
jgi:hypothetical protein